MKNLIFNSLWLMGILLPFVSLNAQDASPVYQDTLVVKLQGKSQVRLLGWKLKNLADYKSFDSINTLFWKDFDSEFASKPAAEWPLNLHYLVHPSGKRRMKVDELAEQQAFSLANEKLTIEEDLPEFHYIVYDLIHDVKIHYYLENPAASKEFKGLKFESISPLLQTKKDDFKRNFRLDFSIPENRSTLTRRNEFGSLMIHPDVKVNVIGSNLIPSVGLSSELQFQNRFGKEKFAVGFAYSALAFNQFVDGKLGNIQLANAYDLRFKVNMNVYGKDPNWLGIELGYIKYDKAQTTKFLGEQPFKYEVFTNVKSIGIGFGAIVDLKNSDRQSTIITMRLPF